MRRKKKKAKNKRTRGNRHSKTRPEVHLCQCCGTGYPTLVQKCARCHLLLGRNYKPGLCHGVRPFDRSTQLDSKSLFKPQEGSFSAPLRLRHHDDPLEQALSRRHQRGNTAEDATVLVKKQGRILVDACVIDTIVDATAMLTESLCEQGLAIRYLRQLGKRYRHSFCLIFN